MQRQHCGADQAPGLAGNVASIQAGVDQLSHRRAVLEEAIRQAGYGTARLEVLTANVRALALYRRRGYRRVWEAFKRDLSVGIELHKTALVKSL